VGFFGFLEKITYFSVKIFLDILFAFLKEPDTFAFISRATETLGYGLAINYKPSIIKTLNIFIFNQHLFLDMQKKFLFFHVAQPHFMNVTCSDMYNKYNRLKLLETSYNRFQSSRNIPWKQHNISVY